jgi:small-conductance mechanosensitive channel
MIRALVTVISVAFVAVWLPLGAAAQVSSDPVAEIAPTDFDRLATRAEDLAAGQTPSLFAIGRLRSDLVDWRDVFLTQSDVNAGRIATVDAQLAALGPVPDGGSEPQAVADRRAILLVQRQNLAAPRLLAQESYARADGLIGEFDTIILQREAAQLGIRSPFPFHPTHIIGAVAALWSLVQVIGVEVGVGITGALADDTSFQILPRALGLFIVGGGLLGMGRRVVTRWRNSLPIQAGRWRAMQLFVLSLVQIAVPLIGLFAVTQALRLLDILGLRGTDVLNAVPAAGASVIFGWWLARQIFPEGATAGYLGYDQGTRQSGRRYTGALAWVVALNIVIDAGMRTIDLTSGAAAALAWPLLAVLGVLFWQLGRVIKTLPEPVEGTVVSAGRVRGMVGRAAIVIAIVSPVIAGFGFVTAAQALMIPAIYSAGLVGVVLIIQRIANDLTNSPQPDDENRGLMALLPVFISFVIYLASLPMFALIWGATTEELIEVWTRFGEGFAVGETQISPADFLTFVAVFAVGYLLTRFIQGTLRKSVMPRTRLDLGGQNAIVAGFGYVGIILAAIVAITMAGIDLSNIALVAGALSVGIGFGLQNIVSNFVSGIILLIERPVSEGDWIEVAGQMGYVRAISVRSTRIETFDRTDVIIPNADLVSGQVTNWTRGNLVGRVIVPVGVAYGSDVDQVTRILQEIAEAHPMVLMTPPPAVIFQEFGADSLNFEIRAILRDVNYVLVTKSEMNHAISNKFTEAGIEIPFAQRDIWLRNPEVLKGNA